MHSRFSRRALAVVIVAVLAATAARLAAPTEAQPTKVSRALVCGSYRWYAKTLQDRPRLLRARKTTVAFLSGLPRPKPAPTNRSPFERSIYSVDAAVTRVIREGDHDLHAILEDGPAHMVAESPDAPFCTVRATPHWRKQMAAAHRKVRVCARARIVGVVFWDRPYDGAGRAPNAIELHPILDFACLSKRPR